MLGFLFKILVIAGIVAGGGYYVMKNGIPDFKNFNLSSLPLNQEALSQLTANKDPKQLVAQASGMLDSLVTHPGKNSGPVVLGIQVTNDSLNTVVDVLRNLPPEQVQQVKDALCAPTN